MNKDIIKEQISTLLANSNSSNEEGKFLTMKYLIKEFQASSRDELLEILNEMYAEGFVHYSRGMRENGSGYIYHIKPFKKPLVQFPKKDRRLPKVNITTIFFMIVLFCGVLVSTTYTQKAMHLIGMDLKGFTIIVAFLVSSLSIICNSIIRSTHRSDKVLIGIGLGVLIVVNLFCTATVIINNYESERVAINPKTVKYQQLLEDKKVMLDNIDSAREQAKTQQKLAIQYADTTNNVGNSSQFYERQARNFLKNVDSLNLELTELNEQINELAAKDVNVEKKKNSYDMIASVIGISPGSIVILVAVMLSFIYDVFCPFLIGFLLSEKQGGINDNNNK